MFVQCHSGKNNQSHFYASYEQAGCLRYVPQGCHFLRALLRNNEASLPTVESSLLFGNGCTFSEFALIGSIAQFYGSTSMA
jgi:hypothetical protein